MTEYSFRLLTVTLTVRTIPRKSGFEALVKGAGGEVIGRGQDRTEPGALGLAVLAARQAFEVCNGCGQTFYRDELEQDAAGFWYCGDCR